MYFSLTPRIRSLRPGVTRLLLLVVALGFFASSPPAHAQDERKPALVIVPPGESSVLIPWGEWYPRDMRAPEEVVLTRPPRHGSVSFEPEGPRYTPSESFWHVGSDAFSFRATFGGVPADEESASIMLWMPDDRPRGPGEPKGRGEPPYPNGAQGSGASSTFRPPSGGTGGGLSRSDYAPVMIYRGLAAGREQLRLVLTQGGTGFWIQALSATGDRSAPRFIQGGVDHTYEITLTTGDGPGAFFRLDGILVDRLTVHGHDATGHLVPRWRHESGVWPLEKGPVPNVEISDFTVDGAPVAGATRGTVRTGGP